MSHSLSPTFKGEQDVNVTCNYCGHVATKEDMILSRHTGNAYCRNEHDCAKRKSSAIRKEESVRVSRRNS